MTHEDLIALIYGPKAGEKKFADLLWSSSFDELFEIDLKADSLHNLYHTKNKYSIPILDGTFSSVSKFAANHFVHPEDQFRQLAFLDPATLEDRAAESSIPGIIVDSFRLQLLDGTFSRVRYLLLTGEEHGVPAGKWYLYIYDVQRKKNLIQDFHSGAEDVPELDPITGLCRSEDFFRQAPRFRDSAKNLCCLSLDIDHFTMYNAVYGKDKGDRLLAAFGQALRQFAETQHALAGFFGQDDFAILTEYDQVWISNLYEFLRCTIANCGNTVGFTPAIGIYHLADDEIPGTDMYDKALSAMMEAKMKTSDRIVEYSITAHQTELEEFQVLIDLQKAIQEERLEFFLQPQCRISTGRIIGAEALVRLRDKDGSLIPPGKFIPILEKNGCIADLDKRVWRMVCQWLRSLLDRGILPVPISINVSQTDILTMDVVSYLYSLTQEFNIPTSLLKVEITESSYAEKTEIVEDFVKDLSRRGFVSLMDDFGSGYSSLNMLETLTVDVLKLDMAFMQKNKTRTRRSVTIIESIINMAKMMGLPIIIEGVETSQQVQFLQSMGCRYAQGYYFYRPIPKLDFEKLLTTPNLMDSRGIVEKANEQYHVREFLDENTFTDAMLNNILGPVAFYSYDGKDLTINRFNQQFYRAIGDVRMESRQQGIQQYVVEEDRPALIKALETAVRDPANGGSCEVRFYKSNGCIFWFHMHLFHLKNEDQKKIFYGQIEDITEWREQSLQFFDVLRQQSKLCMQINLNQETIQYVNSGNTLMQPGLPSMPLAISMERTAANRIPTEAERQQFLHFFRADRLREMYRKGIYHETLRLNFSLEPTANPEPIEFSTYYIRYNQEQDLNIYVFVRDCI